MGKCKDIDIWFEPSDTKEFQGTKEEAYKKAKAGHYKIDEYKSKNGYWLLIKKARAMITTKENPEPQNIRNEILNFYEKEKLTRKRVETLTQDLKDGKIVISIDDNEEYHIEKT